MDQSETTEIESNQPTKEPSPSPHRAPPSQSYQVGTLPEDGRQDVEGIHLLVSFEAESFEGKPLQEALEESTERCLG